MREKGRGGFGNFCGQDFSEKKEEGDECSDVLPRPRFQARLLCRQLLGQPGAVSPFRGHCCGATSSQGHAPFPGWTTSSD